ncbi:MAG: monovalent cation/H+ antiporter subunit D [Rhodocyclaceae bacterium]|nr:monovalent cation/H+ antiporter subunit D [Rhodocyclaceae bacterium]
MIELVAKHLPVLPIAIALVAAAWCLTVPESKTRLQRGVAWAALLLLLAVALFAVNRTARGEQFVYLLGNWKAPYGIALVVDKLTAIMLLLTTFVGAVVFAATNFKPADGKPVSTGTYFTPLFLLQLAGLNGAFLTADLFNLFVFFEVLLAASYGMLLQHSDQRRTNAAIHYVVINLAGSAIFLIAVSLLYGVTGTLNMADLSQRISVIPAHSQALAAAAGFLLLVVFAIKAALLPLNFWLTNTYRAAVLPVAALFALMTKVGVVAIIRTMTLIFPEGGIINQYMSQALLIIAPLTLLAAAAGALSARDVRSLIGWSVVASAGLLVCAVAMGGTMALSGALFYLIGSTLATALLFLNTAAIDEVGPRLAAADTVPGSAWAWTGALFFIGAAALAGLPPFAGFIGKAAVLAGSVNQAWQGWLWFAILGGGLVSMLAYARMGSRLFWKRDAADNVPAYLVPCIAIATALVCLTVFAAPIQRYTDQAAVELRRPQAMISNVLGKLAIEKSATQDINKLGAPK